MRLRTFFINGIILTAASLILRYAGIWYNVRITSLIGEGGMGLFQLTLSVYSLFATFATSGVSISVTRLLSENHPRSAKSIMKSGVIISLSLSAAAALLLYNGADFIASIWLGDSRAAQSLRFFSFALVAISISGCVNGWFLAKRRIARSTSVSFIEQIARIGATLAIVAAVRPGSVQDACSCVALSSVLAEYVSMLTGLCVYCVSGIIDRKVPSTAATRSEPGHARALLRIMAPIAASAYVRAGLRTVENILTPWGLQANGSSRTDALAGYGVLKAMVMPVIYFPATVVSSFATLLIPELAELRTKRGAEFLQDAVRRVFKVTLMYALFCCACLVLFADTVCAAAYKNSQMAALLRPMALLVPLMYLDNATDAMLNALNQQMSALKINTMDSVMRIGLMAVLMPLFGINGYVAVMFISTAFNAALSVRRLLAFTGVRMEIKGWIITPALAAIPAALSGEIIRAALSLTGTPGLIAALIVAALAYAFFLRLFSGGGKFTLFDMAR